MMSLSPFLLCSLLFFLSLLNSPLTSADDVPLGEWTLLQKSIGISAMHMQLLNNDRVIIFDRTDFGRSNLSLPDGKCRNDSNDSTLKYDCTAHSAEYNVYNNSIRALMVLTDTWCSSGAVAADGRLIQTGGYNDGERVVRIFKPCDTCDWEEISNGLSARRWYATNNVLPDGRIIIIGARQQFNYEYYPKSTSTNMTFSLPFLKQTSDRYEDNLYPYVYLNVDGKLFIFANNKSILFNYTSNSVVQTYPDIPDGNPRNYPSTGSSVLLPLKLNSSSLVDVEILICGGAPKGSMQKATSGKFVEALNTCGRIRITDPNPTWTMETMPLARVMGDMTLLPNGQVVIINGASRGVAGWDMGRDPVFYPVLYQPDKQNVSARFQLQNPSSIPRMYHSTAILLRDGRVLVGGSNPHQYYNFTGVLYPTELSLEAFSPGYLNSTYSGLRPTITSPISYTKLKYGQQLPIRFSVPSGTTVNRKAIKVTMVSPSFTTHSFSQNQRLLVLNAGHVLPVTDITYGLTVMTPNSAFLAPPGYYLLFVVHEDIPSEGVWVQIQ